MPLVQAVGSSRGTEAFISIGHAQTKVRRGCSGGVPGLHASSRTRKRLCSGLKVSGWSMHRSAFGLGRPSSAKEEAETQEETHHA